MSLKKSSILKILLIGVLSTKIIIAILYLTGDVNVFGFLMNDAVAVAEEITTENTNKKQGEEGEQIKEAPFDEQDIVTPEDLQRVINRIEDEKRRLKKEEAELAKEREQLEMLKKEISKQIDELASIQIGIDEGLKTKALQATEAERLRRETEEAKIKHLVKVYTSMKPKTAAELIDKLDMDVILKLFVRMKGEEIGAILSYVERNKAANISEELARINGK
ncbi:MAG: hypothetical protein K9L30_04300 [Desulfobacterales bacterium]|nr:hypothetical protein [Desulfobacterales bacterium]